MWNRELRILIEMQWMGIDIRFRGLLWQAFKQNTTLVPTGEIVDKPLLDCYYQEITEVVGDVTCRMVHDVDNASANRSVAKERMHDVARTRPIICLMGLNRSNVLEKQGDAKNPTKSINYWTLSENLKYI